MIMREFFLALGLMPVLWAILVILLSIPELLS